MADGEGGCGGGEEGVVEDLVLGFGWEVGPGEVACQCSFVVDDGAGFMVVAVSVAGCNMRWGECLASWRDEHASAFRHCAGVVEKAKS